MNNFNNEIIFKYKITKDQFDNLNKLSQKESIEILPKKFEITSALDACCDKCNNKISWINKYFLQISTEMDYKYEQKYSCNISYLKYELDPYFDFFDQSKYCPDDFNIFSNAELKFALVDMIKLLIEKQIIKVN